MLAPSISTMLKSGAFYFYGKCHEKFVSQQISDYKLLLEKCRKIRNNLLCR